MLNNYEQTNFEKAVAQDETLRLSSSLAEIIANYQPETEEQQEKINQSERLQEILASFGDGILNQSIIDAAILYQIDEKEIYKQYFDDFHDNRQRQYVATVLQELSTLDRHQTEHQRNGFSPTMNWSDNLKSTKIDLDRIERVFKNEEIYLEPIIIKAASLFENLNYQLDLDGPELFHLINEVRDFYQPIIKSIGLDGFAMVLSDICYQRILAHAEQEEDLIKAQEYYQQAQSVSFGSIFDNLKIDYQDLVQVAGQRYNESPFVEIIEANAKINDKEVRILGRKKTIGSIGKKCATKEGYQNQTPLDLIGGTVICQDGDLEEIYQTIIQHFQESDLEPVKTPNKGKVFRVNGSQAQIEQMKSSYPDELLEKIEFKQTKDDSYQVAKLTFYIKNEQGEDVPVEIQVVEESSRKQSRNGATSHIKYKNRSLSINFDLLLSYLRDLHENKKHIGTITRQNQANYPTKIARAIEFYQNRVEA